MRTQNYEYLSIWEIAHRWEGFDPGQEGEISVTSKLGERLRQLIWAAIETLNCYDAYGNEIPMQAFWFGLPKTRIAKQLDKALHNPGAHRELLSSVFLSQSEMKKVFTGFETLPAFWFEDWEIAEANKYIKSDTSPEPPKPVRLRPDQQDKATCQSIARALWAKHPEMTIADMSKHPDILIKGNGKAYKGKNTLRNWLKEVAPAAVRKRRGRPRKSASSRKTPT